MKTPLKPLVSVLLPTRKRPERLLKCIKSIINSASGQNEFEIIVRIHRDDERSISLIPLLITLANIKIVIGYPFSGYGDLSRFYQDAAGIANGRWIWVMNDDVIISGTSWDIEVEKYAPDKILMPSTHKLGEATYFNDQHNPFMFLPNKCWEQYGMKYFATPFDCGLWNLMREHGWRTEYLAGVCVHHQREHDDTLLPSRIRDYQEHHMENL